MVAPYRLRLYSVLQGVRVAGWMCMVTTVWKCGRVVIDFGWRLATWGMDEGGWYRMTLNHDSMSAVIGSLPLSLAFGRESWRVERNRESAFNIAMECSSSYWLSPSRFSSFSIPSISIPDFFLSCFMEITRKIAWGFLMWPKPMRTWEQIPSASFNKIQKKKGTNGNAKPIKQFVSQKYQPSLVSQSPPEEVMVTRKACSKKSFWGLAFSAGNGPAVAITMPFSISTTQWNSYGEWGMMVDISTMAI